MWAIRRAAIPFRSRTHRVIISCISTPEIHNEQTQRDVRVVLPTALAREFSASALASSFLRSRNLSSQTGVRSSDDEDLEDGFSDLEVPPVTDKAKDEADEANAGDVIGKDDDMDSVSEEEGDEEAADGGLGLLDGGLGLLDGEVVADGEKGAGRKRRSTNSPLFKSLMEARQPVSAVLNKWIEEGKPLGRNEIMLAMLNLRQRKLYTKALQFMEWLEENKCLDFIERDYGSHLDLIAKVHGLQKAEKFIEKIPESFRGEVVYRTLLANCVSRGNTQKAEGIFNKIRDSSFPITIFTCNQLLLLYKRTDQKKLADVLKLMEQEGIEPSRFTYNLLINIKGRSKDISGMEELIEMMKAKGIEFNIGTQAMVAKHYIFGRHYEKAEAVLKEIEGEDIKENRLARRVLLPLYASLGKDADVERVWKACEANPHLEACLAAIEAWGELGKVEKAEEVFEHMMKTWKRLSSKFYNVLLKVYVKHKLLTKGKELTKRMVGNGCHISPLTLDALVKLYVEAGEVEKADSVIQKVVQQNNLRPLNSSYMTVMEKYAQRGDIHNTEKIFLKQKQTGYVGRIRPYQTLLQAYVNAKVPAYGFRERMKGDNMFPNKAVAAQLASIDAFKKSPISQLLD